MHDDGDSVWLECQQKRQLEVPGAQPGDQASQGPGARAWLQGSALNALNALKALKALNALKAYSRSRFDIWTARSAVAKLQNGRGQRFCFLNAFCMCYN